MKVEAEVEQVHFLLCVGECHTCWELTEEQSNASNTVSSYDERRNLKMDILVQCLGHTGKSRYQSLHKKLKAGSSFHLPDRLRHSLLAFVFLGRASILPCAVSAPATTISSIAFVAVVRQIN